MKYALRDAEERVGRDIFYVYPVILSEVQDGMYSTPIFYFSPEQTCEVDWAESN